MNRFSRRAPAPLLVELTVVDLEMVSGGAASWGTCFADSVAWGAGGAVAGSGGGLGGMALGALGGAGANFATDPNCYNGTDSYASAAGHALDGYFSGQGSGGSSSNDGSDTGGGDYGGGSFGGGGSYDPGASYGD